MVQPKKTALFLGDFDDANYHPATDIDQLVVALLEEKFVTTVEEDYADLTLEKLKQYDLLINYADQWGKRGSARAVAAVIAYAATGGSVLGLHSGIIAPMDQYPEIPMLFGARFTEHPPYQALEYVAAPTQETHPIMVGFTPFAMTEEPYLFDFCNFSRRDLLCEFVYEDKHYPAAWISHFGEGRIVYLSPGHDVKTFRNPQMQRLIRRSALWAADLL